MDDDKKLLIDTNKDNLARVMSLASMMDGKATFILTLALALTGYLVTQLGPYLDAHAKWNTMPNWAPACFYFLDGMAAASLGVFIATAICVIECIKPRLTQHTGNASPFFFGSIAEGSHEKFKATMKTITPDMIIDTLADQTYDNAKIADAKTRNVKHSFKLFLWGLCLFLGFTILRPIIISLAK